MADMLIDGGFVPRHYQVPYMAAMDAGCKFAVWVMHRRGGKDRTALAQACKDAFQRVGLYWHCLPTLRQGRKVVWDNITSEGRNLIAQTFPRELVRRKHEDEMKIELVNGSIVQIVGADNFDALVGSSPVHVTFSEWALTDPRAYDYVRPILRENNGSVAFIYTPRGYNHGWKTLQVARKIPGAFVSVMTIEDTGVLSEADIAMERAMDMPDELIRQEYYCDFSVANVGAILGRYMAAAQSEGRFDADSTWALGNRVVLSCDLGYRDAAAFWWWQITPSGFDLINYDEDTGLDASEWITRIVDHGIDIDHVYLPHDARAKTMATKHTVIEQFAKRWQCSVVPRSATADRVNAARIVLPHCRFHPDLCSRGIDALRSWSFKWDEDKKVYSAEPDHNWASHGGDAFSYGAQMVRELVRELGPAAEKTYDGTVYPFSLDDLHEHCGPARFARL